MMDDNETLRAVVALYRERHQSPLADAGAIKRAHDLHGALDADSFAETLKAATASLARDPSATCEERFLEMAQAVFWASPANTGSGQSLHTMLFVSCVQLLQRASLMSHSLATSLIAILLRELHQLSTDALPQLTEIIVKHLTQLNSTQQERQGT